MAWVCWRRREATHRAGIVHRDVNPGNVQLCGGQRVVLTDFGIAATTEDGDAGIPSGGMVGSPAYMAPEQAHGGGRVGPACDPYSLGATLYAAVEGRSPFGKGRAAAILAAVVTDPPAPLRRAGPSTRSSRACWPRTRHGGRVPSRRGPRSRRSPPTTSPPCPVNRAGHRRRPGW